MGGCASKMADSSPAKMKSEQQLGDVSSILQKLKDEVAYLQDEVEAKGAGFYVPLANQLNATRAAMEELTCTLDSCNGGLRSKDADMIPAAVGGAGAVDGESDFGKSIRLIQKSASGARAAYQYASVSAKGLVEDADKLDIVVKACQTFSTRSMQKTRLPLISLTRPTPMLQICADLQRRSGSVRLMSSRRRNTVKSSKQRISLSVKKLQQQLLSGTSWQLNSWVLLVMSATCTTKHNTTNELMIVAIPIIDHSLIIKQIITV